jgi:hypothetical protein
MALSALLVAGCAKSSSDIKAAYIPPVTYSSFPCNQLADEAKRVMAAANEAVGVQDAEATNDAVATGVAIVLFWPAAFMIKGNGETAQQRASLRGQLQAIEEHSIAKRCGIEFRRGGNRETVAS